MLRSGRFKYVAFPHAPEILIDLEVDPDEQHDLSGVPEHKAMLDALRAAAFKGFSFDAAAERRALENAALREQFPKRISARTPNQLLLPDGRLVEGDAVLYLPAVVAEHACTAFDDWPSPSDAGES